MAFCAALALGLSINPAAAQPAVTEAEAHILSAFATMVDPRVFAEDLKLGPALRSQFDQAPPGSKVYEALIERLGTERPGVGALPPAEAARYAPLVGGGSGPLLVFEAGELRLLMQYAAKEKQVAFIEQLSGPPLARRSQAPTPKAAAEPAVAMQKPAPAARPRSGPRGECVIKPVMSEEDLWNCAAPVPSSSVSAQAPAAEPPRPAASQPPQPSGECVIKPVMSDEDLRACGARR